MVSSIAARQGWRTRRYSGYVSAESHIRLPRSYVAVWDDVAAYAKVNETFSMDLDSAIAARCFRPRTNVIARCGRAV